MIDILEYIALTVLIILASAAVFYLGFILGRWYQEIDTIRPITQEEWDELQAKIKNSRSSLESACKEVEDALNKPPR